MRELFHHRALRHGNARVGYRRGRYRGRRVNTQPDTARRNVDDPVRLRVAIRGAVQGVGFRPFVYRLATELGLAGWVLNSAQGVFIEVDGQRATLENFLTRLSTEKPPRSFIQSFEATWLDAAGFHGFEIRHSEREGAVTALVLPDIATCPDCLAEIFDPQNRRHLYPFTNCTNCGPRYSIIEALPYDRPNTSMKNFAMCPDCLREYEDPADRRFHAQPNACSVCGPRLTLWDANGTVLGTEHDALLRAADLLRRGGILAMKGIGGFHLLADARNEDAINTLRARKHREEKPLAVMVPDLAAARALCEVSALEERLLASPEAPIVLIKRREFERAGKGKGGRVRTIDGEFNIARGVVSPSEVEDTLGLMLPYSPLHHILLSELGFPVVATSGNLSDEPICTDEHEALQRLHGIADAFLVHDRPIVRHVDDSVLRVMAGREMLLRRARGFAPLPLPLPDSTRVVIALGAHLKNSVALASGGNAFISQHIGDLETREAHEAFTRVCADLQQLFDAHAEHAVCDMHPDYLSTAHAEKHFASVTRVQHHHAHVASCMADNDLRGPVLGVAWDGTGYGPDGTIWGGEFLLVDDDGYERFASLRPFRLPGGDIAAKEPRRSALGLLYEMHGDAIFDRRDLVPLRAFDADDLPLLQRMLASGYNAPYTSSAGRLFDAVSSLLDLRQVSAFEGQAAMVLEFSTAERDVQTRGRGDAGTRGRGHGDAGTR
ncbi:MAG: carbamoyltransferase HypF [Ignavibacteria bacterium]|nr:carbamoyltransferase HypF [Ignavibacteria bacterium]